MKAAPFEYIRPDTLADVCGILAGQEDARIIAGGQTLVPMMAMRLARPTQLVDINRLAELAFIREQDGAIAIGAITRQVQLEHSALVKASLPLLSRALPWVGHPPTRTRGTIGGSIANADPSAEIPLVAVTLGAEIELLNLEGRTTVAADEFFIGPLLTAMAPGDCLCAVKFPVWPHDRIGAGFCEVSARKSDFAFVAAAAQVALDGDGRLVDIALGIGGVGDRATRLEVSSLVGRVSDKPSMTDAVEAATRDLDASSDLHASAAYRRRVAVVLALRALEEAVEDARTPPAASPGAVQ